MYTVLYGRGLAGEPASVHFPDSYPIYRRLSSQFQFSLSAVTLEYLSLWLTHTKGTYAGWRCVHRALWERTSRRVFRYAWHPGHALWSRHTRVQKTQEDAARDRTVVSSGQMSSNAGTCLSVVVSEFSSLITHGIYRWTAEKTSAVKMYSIYCTDTHKVSVSVSVTIYRSLVNRSCWRSTYKWLTWLV